MPQSSKWPKYSNSQSEKWSPEVSNRGQPNDTKRETIGAEWSSKMVQMTPWDIESQKMEPRGQQKEAKCTKKESSGAESSSKNEPKEAKRKPKYVKREPKGGCSREDDAKMGATSSEESDSQFDDKSNGN